MDIALKAKEVKGRSLMQDAMRRLWRNKLAMVCLFIIIVYIIFALMAIFNIFGVDTNSREYHYESRFVDIFDSKEHIFGTDQVGRDVFSRALVGTKISIYLGSLTVAFSLVLAITLGSIAGYYGGIIDELIVWLMATISSIPGLLLIMAIILVSGRSFLSIAIAFAVGGWIGLARFIRGMFMQAKEFEYVLAAKSMGASDFRIIFKHILPNVFHIAIINSIIQFVGVIKSEVTLAYLGLSVVGVPSWGTLISDSIQEIISDNWQNLVGATVFMFFFVLALNLFGDALRDALDPRLRNS